MTFDELCKAVKKANKEVKVENGRYKTEIKIKGDVIVSIPELSTPKRSSSHFDVNPKKCGVPGFEKIVSVAAEYNNTKILERGLEPLWFIEAFTLEFVRDSIEGVQTEKKSHYLINHREKYRNGYIAKCETAWEWTESFSDRDYFSKKQIKNFLVAAYGEEKAEKSIDSFIETFGTQVQ